MLEMQRAPGKYMKNKDSVTKCPRKSGFFQQKFGHFGKTYASFDAFPGKIIRTSARRRTERFTHHAGFGPVHIPLRYQ
jgi:hypothetical protein